MIMRKYEILYILIVIGILATILLFLSTFWFLIFIGAIGFAILLTMLTKGR